jgi:hypothetical protein
VALAARQKEMTLTAQTKQTEMTARQQIAAEQTEIEKSGWLLNASAPKVGTTGRCKRRRQALTQPRSELRLVTMRQRHPRKPPSKRQSAKLQARLQPRRQNRNQSLREKKK